MSSFQYGECEISRDLVNAVRDADAFEFLGGRIHRATGGVRSFLCTSQGGGAMILPNVADFADHVEVQVGDDDGVLFAGAFGDDLSRGIGEITLSIEFAKFPGLSVPTRLIGPRRICWPPPRRVVRASTSIAEAATVALGLKTISAPLRPSSRRLREMAVIANIDADFADGSLEHGVTRLPGLK